MGNEPRGAAPALSADEWREDLAYMAEEMERRHRNLYHTVSREEFERATQKLNERIPLLARHQIIVGMALLVVPEVLHAVEIAASPDEAHFVVDEDGVRSTLRPEPVAGDAPLQWIDAPDVAPPPKPLWLRDPDNAYWFEYLQDARLLYLQY